LQTDSSDYLVLVLLNVFVVIKILSRNRAFPRWLIDGGIVRVCFQVSDLLHLVPLRLLACLGGVAAISTGTSGSVVHTEMALTDVLQLVHLNLRKLQFGPYLRKL
jgi:hypothetical protein